MAGLSGGEGIAGLGLFLAFMITEKDSVDVKLELHGPGGKP